MAEPRTSKGGGSGSDSPTRYTVLPGLSSQIALRTLPGAVCTLSKEDESDPGHALRLYADPEGMVYLHVRPSNDHAEIGRLVLEAEAGGEVSRHMLELRPSRTPTADMPVPPPLNPKPQREGATIRPALELHEALRLSDEKGLELGYPLRPDPDEAPHAFNAWRRAVSSPATQVEPQLVARPDITHAVAVDRGVHGRVGVEHAPESSGNWSGFELRGAAGTYDWVTGMWNVPAVTGESNKVTYSSFWIGLDGDGTTDLVQDGTEQQNITFDFFFFRLSISAYYAWTEFLPQQPTEHQITNFPINPGDEIFTEVWIGNAGSSPTLAGAFGVFFLQNLTTSEYTYVYTPVGTTAVGGSEAVWIMERPTVGGSLPDLADYRSATMFNAYARRASGSRGYVAYQGATNNQITMFNGSDTLSTVTPIDAYSMRFDWHAFH